VADFNKVILLGRLTRDPELRYTPNGVAVTDLGLAVNRSWGSGADQKKETLFVDITVWQRAAENCAEYLKKGSEVLIEGRLVLESWQGNDGQKRNKLKVVANTVQFLRRAGDGSGGGDGAPAPAGAPETFGGSDEDYPF
jgi:single-strand DNA-binding protein